MRPTLRQLEYIVAVAETGQIGQAAARLNVSQPSLSAQLSEVEKDLGVTLFHRSRTGARITPIGNDILRHARQILHQVQDLRATAQGGGLFHGRLRLGVLASIGPYLLPPVVQRLHRDHPSVRLIIREENTADLDRGLRDGRLDMILSTPEDHPGTSLTHLFSEQFWVAMARDHPLATSDSALGLNDLSGQTILTLGHGFRLTQMVNGLAALSGGRVSDEYAGTSLDAIRLMAASGTGLAILPSIYTLTEARRANDVILRPLNHPAAQRQIVLAQPRQQNGDKDSGILADILKQEAARLMA